MSDFAYRPHDVLPRKLHDCEQCRHYLGKCMKGHHPVRAYSPEGGWSLYHRCNEFEKKSG